MELAENVRHLMTADRFKCWLTLLGPDEATSFDDIARTAGIEPLEKRWHEIDRATAESFLTALLHRSLAYDVELMPAKTAAWLSAQFLDSVGQYDTRYATNATNSLGQLLSSWTPATEYVMDAGVVAIGENGAALYWVADED